MAKEDFRRSAPMREWKKQSSERAYSCFRAAGAARQQAELHARTVLFQCYRQPIAVVNAKEGRQTPTFMVK
jgi:hypothetical protein